MLSKKIPFNNVKNIIGKISKVSFCGFTFDNPPKLIRFNFLATTKETEAKMIFKNIFKTK